MSSIGPQIPAHLLSQLGHSHDESDDDDTQGPQPSSGIGPVIPSQLLKAGNGSSGLKVYDEDDDNYTLALSTAGPSVGPSLPPNYSRDSRKVERAESDDEEVGPSLPSGSGSRPRPGPAMPPPPASQGKRVLGPSFPTYAPTYNEDSHLEEDDDDDDVGPMPLPAGMQHEKPDAVKEFMEREEKRRKAAEEAAKPKTAQREEWMLVPPTSSSLLGNLDPTKLKGRQFSKGSTTSSNKDMSLWTETPAERQQRLADEVSGKKRRVTEAPLEDEDEVKRKRRRKQEEEAIRKGVDDYTRSKRGPSLIDQHSETISKKPGDNEPSKIWDHSRDMGLGGRLMDDEKRGKMLKEAKGLGDRFGSGNSGGFL